MSRTAYSIKNFSVTTVATVLTTLFAFLTRTVFVKTLGAEYLGIDGLFSNILSMLSLTELGVGLSILYALYKPVSEQDQGRIIALMRLYKQIYRVIGFVILGLGLCLIPFLPKLVKDYHRFYELHLNAVLVFLLFLFKTVSSYWFFAYRSTIIKAHQKSYVVDQIRIVFILLSNIAQIAVLWLFKDFTLYLVTMIAFVILQNIACAIKSDRMYPYLKQKTSDRITRAEVGAIFKDCFAIFLYRINFVVTNATDNIVLSYFLGLKMVGLYSNYVVVYTALRTLLGNFYTALLSSLGNLHVESDQENEYRVYSIINFITFFMYGASAIGFAVLINGFISLWLGADFTVSAWETGGLRISTPLGLLIAVELYLMGINELSGKFRNSTGVFQQGKYRPLVTVIINLLVSAALTPVLGIAGVVVGTITSAVCTYIWFDPWILHKYVFEKPVMPYYIKNLLYAVTVGVTGVAVYGLCRLIPGGTWPMIFLKGGISVAVSSLVFSLIYGRTYEFRYLLNIAMGFLKPTRKQGE